MLHDISVQASTSLIRCELIINIQLSKLQYLLPLARAPISASHFCLNTSQHESSGVRKLLRSTERQENQGRPLRWDLQVCRENVPASVRLTEIQSGSCACGSDGHGQPIRPSLGSHCGPRFRKVNFGPYYSSAFSWNSMVWWRWHKIFSNPSEVFFNLFILLLSMNCTLTRICLRA